MARRLRLAPPAAALSGGFAALRAELGLPAGFAPEVLAEAAAATAPEHPDRTDVELVTIDPPGSRDLDQAYWAARRGGGYRVVYAIADPGSYVTPGGRRGPESRGRGVTLYGPDLRARL